jgi:hypothetical protein
MVRLTTLRTAAVVSALALLAFAGSAAPTATPASARVNISVGLDFGGIGFGYFHSNLSRRGHWINHPLWGDVWVPPRGFRPYYNGYWRYSDYGLLWIGFDRWSDITEHYGRWIWDRYYGTWLWIPGYVWSPGWVVWRTGGGYFGWLAMPPDYGDYYDGPYFGGRYGWSDYYGYEDWYDLSGDSFFNLWIVVDDNHFYRQDYRNYAFRDSRRMRNIINGMNDTTNYVVRGDRIFNQSISAARLESITHQRIEPVEARKMLKGNVPMATVAGGRSLARREGSGESGPHFHDRNLQPLAGRRARGGDAANSLITPEPKRNFRTRGGENQVTPNVGPQPTDEDRARGRNRGVDNQAAPGTQPVPNAVEDRARGRNRGVDDQAAPGTQPVPNAVEDRGGRGLKRGGDNQAAPGTQPVPNAVEDRGGRGLNRGKAEGQSQDAGAAAQQGGQGRERPNADEKKGGEEQPANPDEEKRKKRDRDETSPQ